MNKYNKPKSHFIFEQGSGMYYEMDIDFWCSALWRDIDTILKEFKMSDSALEARFPTLFEFMRTTNASFVNGYEKISSE